MLMRYAYGAAHKTLFLLREKDFFDNFFLFGNWLESLRTLI